MDGGGVGGHDGGCCGKTAGGGDDGGCIGGGRDVDGGGGCDVDGGGGAGGSDGGTACTMLTAGAVVVSTDTPRARLTASLPLATREVRALAMLAASACAASIGARVLPGWAIGYARISASTMIEPARARMETRSGVMPMALARLVAKAVVSKASIVESMVND